MLVEFSLYSVNTNLLAVFSFLMEFPVSDRALSSVDLHVITLWPFTGLDLQLLLTVKPWLPPGSASIDSWPASRPFSLSDRPPRPGFIFPGARLHGLPERRLCLLAVSLESSGHLQISSGSVRVRAAPEPLRHGHAAVDAVPEAPTRCLHGLPASGQADSAVHARRGFAAVCVGAQGRNSDSTAGFSEIRLAYKHVTKHF